MALKREEMEEARKVIAKLDGLYGEMTAAVKRKADAPVTAFQLKLINGIITDANAVLGDRKPLSKFTEFEEDDLPVTGDISMVIAQYVETFEAIRCENIESIGTGRWFWKDSKSTPTVAPRARK